MKTLLLQFHLLVYPLQTIQNLLFMGNRHVSRESYRRCAVICLPIVSTAATSFISL